MMHLTWLRDRELFWLRYGGWTRELVCLWWAWWVAGSWPG
jgi:hypothetical protein